MQRYTPAHVLNFVTSRKAHLDGIELRSAFDELIKEDARALAEAAVTYFWQGMPQISEESIIMQYGLDPRARHYMERKIAELMCEGMEPEALYDHLVGTHYLSPLSDYPWYEILFQYIEAGFVVPPEFMEGVRLGT